MLGEKRVTIVKLSKPDDKDLNKNLQWFGNSLGLFSIRDKDRSCFRIFIELVKATKTQNPLTSDEIASRLELSRGTVVHHVNKMMGSGIVVREGSRYLMRVGSLTTLIEELHKDVSKTCKELRDAAQEIDACLGL
ncbi:ArsR family transcriptional regulator [Candidatus Woesearchaeota archaeon]|nr:ArsR family transcriptional regulator [Candidatus Woesearchaeota archaeon]